MAYSGSWVFSLMISNKSDEDLKVQRSDLSWGHWFRGQEDGKEPITIPANSSKPVEAFALRASSGTATGYQGSCTWASKYGTLTLQVEVPYTADNKVSLKHSNGLVVTGWKDVGKRGHQFSQSIEVAAVPTPAPKPVDDITNWSYIKALREMSTYKIDEYLPAEDTNEMAKLIGRSAIATIEQEYWPGIMDPIYKSYPIQKEKIQEYFAVAVYSRTTTSDARIDVPANVSAIHKEKSEFSTIYKKTVEKSYSVDLAIKGGYAPPTDKGSKTLEGSLSQKFSYRNVTESSCSTYTSKEETLTIDAIAKSRTYVLWTFWTTFAIYRKLKDGTYSLVCVSDWRDASKFAVFTRDK